MAFQVNDLVQVDSPRFPGTWTVEKVNKVNYKLSQAGQRPLNAEKSMVSAACSAGQVVPAPVRSADLRAPLWPGTLVKSSYSKVAGVLLVVTADKGDKVNCSRLGGADGSRYWRLPSGTLEVVELADIKEHL